MAVGQFRLAHKWRRTAARASMKVGSALGYQAARRVGRSSGRMEGVRQQDHHTEQPEHARGGATDRAGTPLPLGFQAEVRVDLFEGGFYLPAVDVPTDGLLGRGTRVSTEQSQRRA